MTDRTASAPQPPESSGKTFRVQRACNGCGEELRAATDAELDAAMYGCPLPDVTSECPRCRS